jgi:hypothetical protein
MIEIKTQFDKLDAALEARLEVIDIEKLIRECQIIYETTDLKEKKQQLASISAGMAQLGRENFLYQSSELGLVQLFIFQSSIAVLYDQSNKFKSAEFYYSKSNEVLNKLKEGFLGEEIKGKVFKSNVLQNYSVDMDNRTITYKKMVDTYEGEEEKDVTIFIDQLSFAAQLNPALLKCFPINVLFKIKEKERDGTDALSRTITSREENLKQLLQTIPRKKGDEEYSDIQRLANMFRSAAASSVLFVALLEEKNKVFDPRETLRVLLRKDTLTQTDLPSIEKLKSKLEYMTILVRGYMVSEASYATQRPESVKELSTIKNSLITSILYIPQIIFEHAKLESFFGENYVSDNGISVVHKNRRHLISHMIRKSIISELTKDLLTSVESRDFNSYFISLAAYKNEYPEFFANAFHKSVVDEEAEEYNEKKENILLQKEKLIRELLTSHEEWSRKPENAQYIPKDEEELTSESLEKRLGWYEQKYDEFMTDFTQFQQSIQPVDVKLNISKEEFLEFIRTRETLERKKIYLVYTNNSGEEVSLKFNLFHLFFNNEPSAECINDNSSSKNGRKQLIPGVSTILRETTRVKDILTEQFIPKGYNTLNIPRSKARILFTKLSTFELGIKNLPSLLDIFSIIDTSKKEEAVKPLLELRFGLEKSLEDTRKKVIKYTELSIVEKQLNHVTESQLETCKLEEATLLHRLTRLNEMIHGVESGELLYKVIEKLEEGNFLFCLLGVKPEEPLEIKCNIILELKKYI